MAVQVASSSWAGFTSKTKYRYDVFLSFRGEDTRKCFTVNLYDALRKKGINAFIDDKKLGKGEQIAPSLLKAIEKSRISIIVFSKNYATSTWYLDELAHIIQCKKKKNQVVMPLFYKVNPIDVQYQKNSFEEAMGALEERFRNEVEKDRKSFEEDRAAYEDRVRKNLEKLQKWRSALFEAASLSSAWLFQDGCEFRFIERIAEHVYDMLPPKPKHNIEHMVGLEPRIEEVISLLNKSDNGVCMLGIYGTGGIGKTALTKAIYNSIFYRFDGACFLLDVNEASKKFQGIANLQQKLLSEILQEKITRFGSAGQGISRIKHRLSHKRVLLVIDDVDEIEQLEQLVGGCDWFGCGSKVIITTRNKQLLIAHNVKRTYELKELDDCNSFELFCRHAFHMSLPPKGYHQMSSHVISYAKGLPLALKLIGANLANKNKKEWTSILEQYDQIPERTIHEVLKISYDCLQDGAKIIFLDVACFFKDETLNSLGEMVQACYSGARFYIDVLIDKSLVAIDENGRLYMHGLIKQMGREIVRKEEPSNPGKHSRLFNYKDVLKVLHENSRFECLTCMNLSQCAFIIEVPDMSEFQSLRKLSFSDCHNLIKVHDSVGYLSKLVELDVCGCVNLTSFPNEINMPSLEVIDLGHCESLDYFPNIVGKMEELRNIWADWTSIKELPPSIGNLMGLDVLDLSNCKSLRELPNGLFTVPNIDMLHLGGSKLGCRKLLEKLMQESQQVIGCTNAHTLDLQDCCLLDEDIHPTLNLFQNLIELNLSGNDFVSLPECLKDCVQLWDLDVSNCKRLRNIPELPSSLSNIKARSCFSLTTESLSHLWSLVFHKELNDLKFIFPATTFPDWFHNSCGGGKISFLARRNFPPLAIALELGKAKRNWRQDLQISLIINGRVVLQNTLGVYDAQGHVVLLNLTPHFSSEDWRWLQRLFTESDWHDVVIHVIGETPDIIVVEGGVYVYQHQTNMKNVQFKSPLLSTTPRKRRTVASAPIDK
ncbi:hypothetical protein QN277_005917 [Acacia crassicarpa]|uniref:TIR domain-containing protein n=1 Tax=Acacia crassicarpa TaxID=499986 RepID=A0AAE1J060_9FABA|nr:hypothetical protein QN277_005917 [Acacia crassicarpa]